MFLLVDCCLLAQFLFAPGVVIAILLMRDDNRLRLWLGRTKARARKVTAVHFVCLAVVAVTATVGVYQEGAGLVGDILFSIASLVFLAVAALVCGLEYRFLTDREASDEQIPSTAESE